MTAYTHTVAWIAAPADRHVANVVFDFIDDDTGGYKTFGNANMRASIVDERIGIDSPITQPKYDIIAALLVGTVSAELRSGVDAWAARQATYDDAGNVISTVDAPTDAEILGLVDRSIIVLDGVLATVMAARNLEVIPRSELPEFSAEFSGEFA